MVRLMSVSGQWRSWIVAHILSPHEALFWHRVGDVDDVCHAKAMRCSGGGRRDGSAARE